MTKKTLLISLLNLFFTINTFSQRVPVTRQTESRSGFENAFIATESSFKKGDYERAFDVSYRLLNTLSSSEKKDRLSRINRESKKLQELRYDAYVAAKNQNYKLALQKYDFILRENPTDLITKKNKENLLLLINQPKSNLIDSILMKANRLFEEALSNSTDLIEKEKKIKIAKEIWTRVIQTAPNFQKELIVNNIYLADKILKTIEGQRIALQKQDITNNKEAEIIKRKEEEQKRLDNFQKLFESLYARGIDALSKCDYKQSLTYFERAHKMKPSAIKTKKYYYDLQAMVVYMGRLESYKRTPNTSFNEILLTYEKIKKLNTDFELTQLNSSCKTVNQEIVTYINTNLPNTADKYSCDRIFYYKSILDAYETTSSEDEKIKNLISTCEDLANICKVSNKLIADRIKEAIRLHNEGFIDASVSSFNMTLIEIKKIKDDCKDFNPSPFYAQIDEYVQKNTLLIAKRDCENKQQIKFENAGNLSDKQDFVRSLVTYNSIDTTCLNKTFKLSLANRKVKIRAQLFISYEDSASRSKSLGYFKDEAQYLLRAYGFASNEVDSARIENKFQLNKCVQENGGKCPEKDAKNIASSVACNDTISVQNKINVLFGFNSGSSKSDILNAMIDINNVRQIGEYNLSPILGVGFNRQSFRKKIDYSVDVFYTLPSKMSFKTPTSNFSTTSATFQSIDTDLKVKFHKIKACPTMGRAFFYLGGNIGYKNLTKSTGDFTSSNYLENKYMDSFHAGFLGGLGYEFPRDRLLLEIGLRKQAAFLTNKIYHNPISSSPFSLGSLFVKVGISLN